MGPEVFDKPPELERAHRSRLPKPKEGAAPRTIIVCFHRYQDKECALRWAKNHKLHYRDDILRLYPDFSAACQENVLHLMRLKLCCTTKAYASDSSCTLPGSESHSEMEKFSLSPHLKKPRHSTLNGLIRLQLKQCYC